MISYAADAKPLDAGSRIRIVKSDDSEIHVGDVATVVWAGYSAPWKVWQMLVDWERTGESSVLLIPPTEIEVLA